MNYIYPVIEPVFKVWEQLTTDQKFKDITEFPGDWHTKWLANERYKVNDQYRAQFKRFYEEPTWGEWLWDNKYRFSLLAFVERWYHVRQAQGFLKSRLQIPQSDVGALNAIRGGGLPGSFRGNLLNIIHATGVHFHALLYARNDPLRYLYYSTLFELALYPLDTLRTLTYADVNRQFKNTFDCVTQTVQKSGLSHFYRGAGLKVVYNAIFGLNVWSYSNDSNLIYLTFPLWVFSYGILSLKTRLQVAGSSLSYYGEQSNETLLNIIVKKESIRGLYNGLLPFLVLNIAAGYYLPGLFSEEKKRRVLGEIRETAPIEYRESKYW